MGWTLVDLAGRPRYWATVWSALEGAALAESTLSVRLASIDELYEATQRKFGRDCLDELIAKLDVEAIECSLECLFVELRNRAAQRRTDTRATWRTAFGFVYSCLTRLAKSLKSIRTLDKLQARLERLERLYKSLSPGKPRNPTFPRALPPTVLLELYALIDPLSNTNPFRTEPLRWRNYLLVLLLLHEGLRRSETLVLPLDALKPNRGSKNSTGKRWLDIIENSYEHDCRSQRPTLKNIFAVRQIPITDTIARIYERYVNDFRPRKSPHSYLFLSQECAPLSKRAVNEVLRVVSSHLSRGSAQALREVMHKAAITPHDLRHTCACVRLKQFIDSGDDMEMAMQKLRSFFGWSRDSEMPRLYARAYFEHQLSTTWNDSFDVHVDSMRALMPSGEAWYEKKA